MLNNCELQGVYYVCDYVSASYGMLMQRGQNWNRSLIEKAQIKAHVNMHICEFQKLMPSTRERPRISFVVSS